ncbi:MAG TPA: hypothetical protein VF395_04515 [Polyangiaceae bacterium]
MRTKLAFTSAALGSITAGLLAFACSSDSTSSTPANPEAGTETGGAGTGGKGTGGKGTGGAGSGGKAAGGAGGTGTGGKGTGGAGTGGTQTTDGGTELSVCGGKTGQAQIDCGEYIVKHIDACADCHSPTDPVTHGPDATKFLQGNATLFDIAPADSATGSIPTPNLTLLKGQGWTAADIKDAVLNGKRTAARGGGMFPIMPYFTFHNMAAADADAIAAYILSLPAAGNPAPGRQPLPAPLDPALFPIPATPATAIPKTTLPSTDAHFADAERGQHLAAQLAPCMECHTEHTPQGSLDTTKLFAGGEKFQVGAPFNTVTSLNITPANNGIKSWKPADVQKLILTGVDTQGQRICPPMPAGPFGAFGGMDPNDALSIGYYLTTIPGIENPVDGGTIGMCVLPPLPKDAGASKDAAHD